MIYKGLNFRRTRNVVDIGTLDGYINFGRIAKAFDKGAVLTAYVKGGKLGSTPVYAVPIKLSSRSRTNMARGVDGRTYLMYDGKFFIAPKPKVTV